jgi:hypothetical protein
MRHTHRKDGTHAEIIRGLRAAGLFVIDTSSLDFFVDLVVAYNGTWFLLEVKNMDTAYGRRGLSEAQRQIALLAGSAPVHVVVDLESALRAIGAL